MKKRILLIDDDVSIFMPYQQLLKDRGRTIDTASTFKRAKELLEHYHYDIMITDLRLSGVESEEGFELIQVAKHSNPRINIIMITAYGDHDIKERAYYLGVTQYFEKPVPIKVLRRWVDEFAKGGKTVTWKKRIGKTRLLNSNQPGILKNTVL